ncbi:Vacuolar protein-sorting-associated protein 27 [Serendipita sp. 411]|nr:Vacuolar protein-sorting-associated protein 27 [Serendipita sp. 411]
MASWIWGTSQFDEEVDKATSELLPTDQEDIALNLEICDQIKAKLVQPKDAMRALKRRLNHKNPNVQLLALTLTDVCVKNGGNHFLAEISSREFMDNLVSIVKIPGLNLDVKNRMLKFIQNWAAALEGKAEFSYVVTIYKQLISEGFKFPPKDPVIANNAMTDTAIAPEWIDSDVCLRCRDSFTFTNRKHHCRNCGQIFDHKCSSKSLPLPHFGIPQAVRVCDTCHFKLTRKKELAAKEAEDSKKVQSQPSRAEQLDFDLARAIELSLKESHGSSNNRAGYAPIDTGANQWKVSEPPIIDRSTAHRDEEEEDEDLRAAIQASLREARAPQPSAPAAEPSTQPVSDSPVALVPSYDLAPLESDAIMSFSQTVAEAQTYGLRDLRQTHDLYRRATTYQPKLTRTLDETEKKEQLLSEMHDKLSQAVKLYDNLLTEQIAQSTRRQQVASQPVYAQYPNHMQQPHRYSVASPYGVNNDQMQLSAQMSPPNMVPQSQWNTQAYGTELTASTSAAPTQVQYGMDRSYISSPAMQSASQPLSAPPQVNQFQMQQESSQASSLPFVTLPVTQAAHQLPHQMTTSQSPAPLPYAMPTSPTPAHSQQQLQHQPTAALRTSQGYHAPEQSLSRSNTLGPTSQRNQYSSQHQYQAPQQPVAQPVSLPVLPTAPTNAPSTFALYGPSSTVPSIPAAPKAEPKEAMLIEL